MNAATDGLDPRLGRQRGFSLIELMIAMAIGLFLIAAVGYVFLGAKTSFNHMDALSRIQENARFAFDYMGKDIRLAGYTGGPTDGGSPTNVLNTPTWDPNLRDLYGTPLIGYEQGGIFPTGVSPLAGTDALTIVHADADNQYSLCLDADVDATCTLDNPQGTFKFRFATCPTSGLPNAGEVFVAADYTHSAVFQIGTAGSCSSGSMTLGYSVGTSNPAPGNSSTDLGTFAGAIKARKLYPLKAATYYIRNNAAGEPSLYRLELGHESGSSMVESVEVVEGVENMQILYGEDTTNLPPNAPVAVSAYCTADSVGNWSHVLSVRITLTLVSQQGLRVAASGDGLLRKTITNTIAVRNRLL